MEGVVGVFSSRAAAESATRELRNLGFAEDAIVFLTPHASSKEIGEIPVTDAESPGIGKAISSYLGGAIGAGAGLGLGTAAASLFVPGVGPIFAAGVGAAALLGVSGAAIGAAVGKETETDLDEGVPRDDVETYRRLLRENRSIVVVSVDSVEKAAQVRSFLEEHGGEPFDRGRREPDARDAA